jgi:dihydroorotase
MPRLLIRKATVVDPSQGLHAPMDVLAEDGRIAALNNRIDAEPDMTVVEAEGLVLAPGFIDIHVHLREPGGEGAETIETGTRAAAAGGFTTIYAMPNTNPVCDTHTGVHYVLSRAANVGCIRVVPVAAITIGQQGERLTDFGLLKAAGAGAFSDDGHPVMNSEIMRRALEYTRMLEVPVMEHCEDMNLTGEGVMHEGPVSLRLGLRGIPRVSESVMVARNIALAAMTGGHIHICHVSTRESVEAIREGKRNGVHVTAEVSPHHLTLTDSAVIGYNTNAKMKPPLNAEVDRHALIAALEDGTIDCIATDHAPHGASAKNSVFDAAPFGIIGLETAFPLLYTEFVATGRWSIDFLIERLTQAPASVVRQPWGSLSPGSAADMVLIDTNCSYTFTDAHLRSKSRNSPFLGRTMKARIVSTYHDGRCVFQTTPDEVAGDDQKPRRARKAIKR